MEKNIDTEHAIHDHINESAKKAAAKLQEQLNEAFAKAAEEAKKNRKRKLAREVALCFLTVAGIAGLYAAEIAGLISPVLTDPVCSIGFVYIGWHLCKIDRMKVRK